MRIIYLDCRMGAAGDMLAGALLELHPDPQGFLRRFNALGIPGVEAAAVPSVKCGITGTQVSVTVGGAEEPADAAELYGLLNALVWTGMPALERLVDVPDPQIHTGIDFDAPQTRAEGELGLSIRLGTLIAVGLTLGLPALKWLRSYCKRHGPRQTAPRAAEHPAA